MSQDEQSVKNALEGVENRLMLLVRGAYRQGQESRQAEVDALQAELDRRPMRYGTVDGEQRTIHGTEHLDIEVTPSGEVVAVWFRCLVLPFEPHTVEPDRARDMREIYQAGVPRLLNVEVIRKDRPADAA